MNIGAILALAAGEGEPIGLDGPVREEKPIPEYQRRQRAFEEAVRPRLIASSRAIREQRLERRRGLPDGKLFVVRQERR